MYNSVQCLLNVFITLDNLLYKIWINVQKGRAVGMLSDQPNIRPRKGDGWIITVQKSRNVYLIFFETIDERKTGS